MAWGNFLTDDTVLKWASTASEFDPSNDGLPITIACWCRWVTDHPQGWGQVLLATNGNNTHVTSLVTNSTDNSHQAWSQGATTTRSTGFATVDTGTDWFFWAGTYSASLTNMECRIRYNSTSYSNTNESGTADFTLGHNMISIGGRELGLSQRDCVICHAAYWNSVLTAQQIDDLGDGLGTPLTIGSNLLYYYPLTNQTDFTDANSTGAALVWQEGAATWYDEDPIGPTITDFGDENHQWGESGLVITGTGFGT